MRTANQSVASRHQRRGSNSKSRQTITATTPTVLTYKTMIFVSTSLLAVLAAITLRSRFVSAWSQDQIPDQAQYISPKSWAVLDQVPPPSIANGTTVSHPSSSVADCSTSFLPGRRKSRSKPNLSSYTRTSSTRSLAPIRH